MSPDTIKDYMAQRATFVARLIEMSPAWDNYATTVAMLKGEITRIDMIVGKQTFADQLKREGAAIGGMD